MEKGHVSQVRYCESVLPSVFILMPGMGVGAETGDSPEAS